MYDISRSSHMITNIIFDFDGVILDSIPVKTEAFRKLFEEFKYDKVEELIKYHLENGGKSRYIKIKYFFNNILNKKISEERILSYADKYSELTREELSKEIYLISDTINFIQKNYKNYNMHIASGADEKDLISICESLELNQYFLSINGSPKIKSEIVEEILELNFYKKDKTILIGDSINDFEAANINNISFYGFNNNLLKKDYMYIDVFSEFGYECN